MLTPEQIKELKAQLISQVQNLPADKKEQAIEEVNNMSAETLEYMLEKQKEMQSTGSNDSKASNKGVMRMIVDGDIPSKKIDENKDAIAVLEIKPISKGHTIIIPKKQVKNAKELPVSSLSLANKVSKKIIRVLKSTSAEIQTEFKLGEIIINVIPIYDKSLNINSPRLESSEKELSEIYDKLRIIKKKRIAVIKKTKDSVSEVLKQHKRIP